MAKHKKNKIVRRRERPLVILSELSRDMIQPMTEIAREWEWELRGTWISSAELPRDRALAGALITDLPITPLAQHLRDVACPAVRIGARPHPDDELLPAVLPDLAASGRLAAEHFAARSFKNVAYVGHKPDNLDANTHATYKAFRQRTGELGMACHLMSTAAMGKQAGRTGELVTWLDRLPKPVGVFCFNDIMAERVGLASVQANLTVPEDVALLGYGNSLQCQIMPVRLSSVDPGLDERVKVAMRLLRKLMKGEPAPKQPIMVPPAGVVERRSTNVLAVANPTVARALRFMWDHFDQDLSVDDVADELDVNRRTLERLFQRTLGRSLRHELRRRRLQVACDLLRSTNDPIADIAPRVGYRSTQYLHRAFRDAYGMTPRAYRLGGEGE
jgi:LacI family transcriptional regulator